MKDILQDPNLELFFQVSNLTDIPDYVKEASVVSEATDIQNLPAATFADPRQKKFACHTRQDTWMSAAYFNMQDKTAAADDDTEYILKQACEMWGIDFESTKPQKEMPKEASATAEVEYVYKGNVENKVPVYTKEDVHTLCEDLQKNAASFPWETRHSLANQLHYLANHFGDTQTASNLNKLAGKGAGSTKDAMEAIQLRKVAASQRQNKFVTPMNNLAILVAENDDNGLVHPDVLYKVAACLDQVDKALSLDAHYGNGIRMPEEQLFGITWDKVAFFNENSISLSNGSTVQKQELLSDPMRQYMDVCLGINKTASDEEYLEAVSALPRDLSKHVAAQIKELV